MARITIPGSSAWWQFLSTSVDTIILDTNKRLEEADTIQDNCDEKNWETAILIILFVADDELLQVPFGQTIAEIWSYLKGLHETLGESRAFFLKNTLFLIMMDDCISLQERLNKIKDICDKLEAIGCKMEEDMW